MSRQTFPGVCARAKIPFAMKVRRHLGRPHPGLVLCIVTVLATEVAASEEPGRAGRASVRAPVLAKTGTHGGKGRRGQGSGPTITFTGFHVFDDGSSRIFVKLTSEVPVDARYSGKKLEYTFRGANIPLRNNKNPLITEHFPASIVSARFAHDKKGKRREASSDPRLEIVLREESKPPHKVERMPDGTAIFTVDLPKPTTPPPPAPDPVPPAPKS